MFRFPKTLSTFLEVLTSGRVLPSPAVRSKLPVGMALCLPCNPLGKSHLFAALLTVFNDTCPSLESP